MKFKVFYEIATLLTFIIDLHLLGLATCNLMIVYLAN